MKVHVFGSKSSPTTCLFALKKTAEDNKSDFPQAAESVATSFYVDNYWESFPSEQEAIEVSRSLNALLAKGGFNLTKWTSNSRKVLSELQPLGLATPSSNLDLEKLDAERTLGLLWDREEDSFTFKIKESVKNEEWPTRKGFLSVVLSVFDPFGFVAPVVFSMKVLMQKICGHNVDYDEKIPEEFVPIYLKWCRDLHHLEQVRVPRCFASGNRIVSRQLHVFTDASNAGYGAVAYVRTVCEDTVQVAFVMAKTHVAPHKKKQTIPRLELLGAMEGLALATLVSRELRMDVREAIFHTDSQIVLRWINSKTCKFEIFVENRIGRIVQETDRTQWRFVPGVDNPADMCSRGLQPHELSELEYLHIGPPFLLEEPAKWPRWEAISPNSDELPEDVHVNSITENESTHVIDQCISRYSSKLRLQRVIGWCLRFVSNLKAKKAGREVTRGELDAEEMEWALKLCIRRVQEVAYPDEVRAIKSKGQVKSSSNIKQLSPFVDEVGLLRVGGRLSLAPMSYDVKHPVILPAKHQLTVLIVRDMHQRKFHAKAERLLAELRQLYWIPQGRRVAKAVASRCVPCRKREAQMCAPLMAPLPLARVTPRVRPFTYTGVDFFGPLTVTLGGRGRRHEKRWICLFTCLTVRAVHLEVTDGLSSDEFLMCLSRFTSIRGKPSEMFSDNGTNFVAVERELREDVEKMQQCSNLQMKLACQGIKWHFSPPNAPHFGGAWERLVQSSKRLLKAALGLQVVNDQVLRTVIVEVTAMQNARPLTQLGVNPDDEEPLTPNHFLVGHAQSYTPLKLEDVSEYKLSIKHFRVSQEILDHIWRRWMKEYVPELNRRQKWSEHVSTAKVGDLVLIPDPLNPRGQWPVGRILEIIDSRDGIPRVVKVATSRGRGEFVRALSRLVLLLPAEPEANEC